MTAIVVFFLYLSAAFGQTTINLATQSRNADFSAFPFTRPVSVGTSLPSTCLVGQLFFNSAAAAGTNLLSCVSQNIWAVIGPTYSFTGPLTSKSNAVSIAQANSSTDGYLSHVDWNTFSSKQPAGNYITGLTGDILAAGPGSAAATLATVNSSAGQCGDATHVCQVTTNGKGLVTAQTAIAISGAGGGANPGGVAGQIQINVAGTSFGGINAPTGTVVGTTDTQTLTNKTVDGVSPATFGYLDATSSIQTQLNGKQAVGNYLTALSGDIAASGPGSATATLATVNSSSGQCGDATHICQITTNGKGLVTGQTAIALSGGTGTGNATSIQGVTVSSTAPSNLQVLQFQSSSNSYVPTTIAGGTAGTCTQVASQLNDFVPSYSATGGGTVTINPTASSSTPTIVQNGSTFYRGTSPASFFASAGSNTELAYIFVDAGGNLDVGTPTTTISCTGCTYVSGVSAFPAGSKALFTWPISGGALAASGATDWRAFLTGSFTGGSVTSIQLAPSGSQPACSSTLRGTIWFQNNGATQDHLQLCVYTGSAYSWYSIY
jgi:hypothetical protein